MLKITRKKNRIIAMIMLFITIFGIIQPVLAANQSISGSGSDNFTARQYATGIKTTDEGSNTANGIIARRLIMNNQNWNFNNGDGILVFCAQNRVPFETGTAYNGNYYKPTRS